jgi:ABC-type sugar transport system substrate-binding protein
LEQLLSRIKFRIGRNDGRHLDFHKTGPRRLVVAAMSLVAALSLAACGSSGGSSSSSGTTEGGTEAGAESGKSFSLAYFSPIESNPYILAFGKGVEKAAEARGSKVTTYDANGDPGQQASQIQTATSAGNFDGFVLVSITPAALPAVTKAHGEGITTVCAITICGNNPIATENENADVVASQLVINIPEQEELQAEAIVKACEGTNPCNVVYIPGTLVDPRTTARIEHLKEDLAEHSEIKLLSTEQSGEDNVAKAQDAASNLLATYPEMNVLACSSDQCSLGAETALKKAGKVDKVKLVSATGSEQGAEEVADGTWFADAFPETIVTYAEEATNALLDSLEGKEVPTTITAKFQPPVLYKDNASSFEADWSAR